MRTARARGVRVVLAIVAAAVVAAGFGGFIATRSVHTHVEAADYYEAALADSGVYGRIYDDVLTDPGFAPQVDLLLAGVDLGRTEVVGLVRQVIPPAELERMAHAVVIRLVDHFKAGAPLDLALDITYVIDHVDDLAGMAAAQVLPRLPVETAASYDDFVAQLDGLIGLMRGAGRFPRAVPAYPIPPEHQDEIAATLIAAAELSPDRAGDAAVIDAVRAAIAAQDAPAAIRASAAGLLHRVIARSIELLVHDPHVTRVERPDGTHYVLAPSAAVTRTIDRKLRWIGRLDRAAGWGQIAAAAAFLAGLVGLLALWRRHRRAQLAWLGGALAAAGALGFAGWWIGRLITERALTGFVASRKLLPATVKAILDDVVGASLGALTPSIWIPSVAAFALGAALLVGAARSRSPFLAQ